MITSSRFDDSYLGTPAWDIGRPQPAIERLAESGKIRGRVLDVGCGTGENALYLASSGYDVTGIDGAPRAIAKARAKAKRRALTISFEVADALNLPSPAQPFDTIIDSGLFHVFSDEARAPFAASLGRVIRPGGTYFLMCFSEHEPGDWGPRRVTQQEIRTTFAKGWVVNSIDAATFDTNHGDVKAWLASITRAAPGS